MKTDPKIYSSSIVSKYNNDLDHQTRTNHDENPQEKIANTLSSSDILFLMSQLFYGYAQSVITSLKDVASEEMQQRIKHELYVISTQPDLTALLAHIEPVLVDNDFADNNILLTAHQWLKKLADIPSYERISLQQACIASAISQLEQAFSDYGKLQMAHQQQQYYAVRASQEAVAQELRELMHTITGMSAQTSIITHTDNPQDLQALQAQFAWKSLLSNLGKVLQDKIFLHDKHLQQQLSLAEALAELIAILLSQAAIKHNVSNVVTDLTWLNNYVTQYANPDDLHTLKQALQSMLAEPVFSYTEQQNPAKKSLIISAEFITMSELINSPAYQQKIQQAGAIDEIQFRAKQALYLDHDIVAPGKNILIIAPDIYVADNTTINTSGRDAQSHKQPRALGGKALRSHAHVPSGFDGHHGKDGVAGQSAGSVAVLAQTLHNPEKLTIEANGGNACDAQHGGHGDESANGRDGEPGRAKEFSDWEWCSDYRHAYGGEGTLANRGGNGGNGGAAAQGGLPGTISVRDSQHDYIRSQHVNVQAQAGQTGKAGEPGQGAQGGYNGISGTDMLAITAGRLSWGESDYNVTGKNLRAERFKKRRFFVSKTYYKPIVGITKRAHLSQKRTRSAAHSHHGYQRAHKIVARQVASINTTTAVNTILNQTQQFANLQQRQTIEQLSQQHLQQQQQLDAIEVKIQTLQQQQQQITAIFAQHQVTTTHTQIQTQVHTQQMMDLNTQAIGMTASEHSANHPVEILNIEFSYTQLTNELRQSIPVISSRLNYEIDKIIRRLEQLNVEQAINKKTRLQILGQLKQALLNQHNLPDGYIITLLQQFYADIDARHSWVQCQQHQTELHVACQKLNIAINEYQQKYLKKVGQHGGSQVAQKRLQESLQLIFNQLLWQFQRDMPLLKTIYPTLTYRQAFKVLTGLVKQLANIDFQLQSEVLNNVYGFWICAIVQPTLKLRSDFDLAQQVSDYLQQQTSVFDKALLTKIKFLLTQIQLQPEQLDSLLHGLHARFVARTRDLEEQQCFEKIQAYLHDYFNQHYVTECANTITNIIETLEYADYSQASLVFNIFCQQVKNLPFTITFKKYADLLAQLQMQCETHKANAGELLNAILHANRFCQAQATPAKTQLPIKNNARKFDEIAIRIPDEGACNKRISASQQANHFLNNIRKYISNQHCQELTLIAKLIDDDVQFTSFKNLLLTELNDQQVTMTKIRVLSLPWVMRKLVQALQVNAHELISVITTLCEKQRENLAKQNLTFNNIAQEINAICQAGIYHQQDLPQLTSLIPHLLPQDSTQQARALLTELTSVRLFNVACRKLFSKTYLMDEPLWTQLIQTILNQLTQSSRQQPYLLKQLTTIFNYLAECDNLVDDWLQLQQQPLSCWLDSIVFAQTTQLIQTTCAKVISAQDLDNLLFNVDQLKGQTEILNSIKHALINQLLEIPQWPYLITQLAQTRLEPSIQAELLSTSVKSWPALLRVYQIARQLQPTEQQHALALKLARALNELEQREGLDLLTQWLTIIKQHQGLADQTALTLTQAVNRGELIMSPLILQHIAQLPKTAWQSAWLQATQQARSEPYSLEQLLHMMRANPHNETIQDLLIPPTNSHNILECELAQQVKAIHVQLTSASHPLTATLMPTLNFIHKPIEQWSKSDIQQWAQCFKQHPQAVELAKQHYPELIAIVSRICKFECEFYLRDTQYLALLLWLLKPSLAIKMGTGQGKQAVFAALCAILALLGHNVNLYTSNPPLAARDTRKIADILAYFKLTAFNMCETAGYSADELRRAYQAPVVVGDIAAFIGAELQYSLSNRNPIMLCDEGDVMLGAPGNSVYLAFSIQELRQLNPILVLIAKLMTQVPVLNESSVEPITAFIKQQIHAKQLVVPTLLHSLVESSIAYWVRCAMQAKQLQHDVHFVIDPQQGICPLDPKTGVTLMNTQWIVVSWFLHYWYGYSALSDAGTLALKALFASNLAHLTDNKSLLKTASGTPAETVTEKQFLRQEYQLPMCEIPRHQASTLMHQPPMLVQTWQAQLSRLAEVITPRLDDSVVIVFCGSIEQAKQTYQYLATVAKFNQVFIRAHSNDTQCLKGDVESALTKGDILVTTDLLARGWDPQLDDKKLRLIGVYLNPGKSAADIEQRDGRFKRGIAAEVIYILCDPTGSKTFEQIIQERDQQHQTEIKHMSTHLVPRVKFEAMVQREYHTLQTEIRHYLENIFTQKYSNIIDSLMHEIMNGLASHWALWLYDITLPLHERVPTATDERLAKEKFKQFSQAMWALAQQNTAYRFANFTSALTSLGLLYMKHHYLEEARACFEQAIACEPQYCEAALYHLALLTLRQSTTFSARQSATRLLKSALTLFNKRKLDVKIQLAELHELSALSAHAGMAQQSADTERQLQLLAGYYQRFIDSIHTIIGKTHVNSAYLAPYVDSQLDAEKFHAQLIAQKLLKPTRISRKLRLKKSTDSELPQWFYASRHSGIQAITVPTECISFISAVIHYFQQKLQSGSHLADRTINLSDFITANMQRSVSTFALEEQQQLLTLLWHHLISIEVIKPETLWRPRSTTVSIDKLTRDITACAPSDIAASDILVKALVGDLRLYKDITVNESSIRMTTDARYFNALVVNYVETMLQLPHLIQIEQEKSWWNWGAFLVMMWGATLAVVGAVVGLPQLTEYGLQTIFYGLSLWIQGKQFNFTDYAIFSAVALVNAKVAEFKIQLLHMSAGIEVTQAVVPTTTRLAPPIIKQTAQLLSPLAVSTVISQLNRKQIQQQVEKSLLTRISSATHSSRQVLYAAVDQLYKTSFEPGQVPKIVESVLHEVLTTTEPLQPHSQAAQRRFILESLSTAGELHHLLSAQLASLTHQQVVGTVTQYVFANLDNLDAMHQQLHYTENMMKRMTTIIQQRTQQLAKQRAQIPAANIKQDSPDSYQTFTQQTLPTLLAVLDKQAQQGLWTLVLTPLITYATEKALEFFQRSLVEIKKQITVKMTQRLQEESDNAATLQTDNTPAEHHNFNNSQLTNATLSNEELRDEKLLLCVNRTELPPEDLFYSKDVYGFFPMRGLQLGHLDIYYEKGISLPSWNIRIKTPDEIKSAPQTENAVYLVNDKIDLFFDCNCVVINLSKAERLGCKIYKKHENLVLMGNEQGAIPAEAVIGFKAASPVTSKQDPYIFNLFEEYSIVKAFLNYPCRDKSERMELGNELYKTLVEEIDWMLTKVHPSRQTDISALEHCKKQLSSSLVREQLIWNFYNPEFCQKLIEKVEEIFYPPMQQALVHYVSDVNSRSIFGKPDYITYGELLAAVTNNMPVYGWDYILNKQLEYPIFKRPVEGEQQLKQLSKDVTNNLGRNNYVVATVDRIFDSSANHVTLVSETLLTSTLNNSALVPVSTAKKLSAHSSSSNEQTITHTNSSLPKNLAVVPHKIIGKKYFHPLLQLVIEALQIGNQETIEPPLPVLHRLLSEQFRYWIDLFWLEEQKPFSRWDSRQFRLEPYTYEAIQTMRKRAGWLIKPGELKCKFSTLSTAALSALPAGSVVGYKIDQRSFNLIQEKYRKNYFLTYVFHEDHFKLVDALQPLWPLIKRVTGINLSKFSDFNNFKFGVKRLLEFFKEHGLIVPQVREAAITGLFNQENPLPAEILTKKLSDELLDLIVDMTRSKLQECGLEPLYKNKDGVTPVDIVRAFTHLPIYDNELRLVVNEYGGVTQYGKQLCEDYAFGPRIPVRAEVEKYQALNKESLPAFFTLDSSGRFLKFSPPTGKERVKEVDERDQELHRMLELM
ncbi:MAG: hypothetical protein Tsb005_16070 [Gammaproteobacteria bacterium]